MTQMTRRRGAPGAIIAALALLALSACSGGNNAAADVDAQTDSATRSGETSSTDADADADALLFADCMRENGVDMPDPAPGAPGFFDAFHAVRDRYDDATLQDAIAACDDYFPTYGGMEHGQDDETVLALAECLREQGLDVPDDLFQDGALRGIDDDELRAAMQECRDVVAGGGR